MAVCVAVIAKENYPLYIRSVPAENELKFHYMVHTSLDVVDEKISAMGKALVDQRELYLGLLYPTEDYKVYGYVTNSKVKFVMVVDSSNTALRDNEIRSMFRKLHNSYTDVMCNPFYNPGDRIQSSLQINTDLTSACHRGASQRSFHVRVFQTCSWELPVSPHTAPEGLLVAGPSMAW
ncbi:trafficking protein particle complex subunit 2-like protein isoform X2 [Hippopotamus amphibius kiboko]|uniref:trafficking protein particle complex subunit 2-like protein isoform X2 n=1 Tax=Hippopotamus amphibius kiboko TaxID=575201 RepID=UPI002597C7C7|nr:trafficking protein particle complex subunit 2-like protein isoform X2 [Hippopotamus amphibius kiboko]